jgi:hypothetical protein
MIPRNDKDFREENSENIDFEEEARVYYVGATRVRQEFFHGVALTLIGAGRLDERGRRVAQIPFSIKGLPKFQFGLANDIDETAIFSQNNEMCATKAQAIQNHHSLISVWEKELSAEQPGSVSANSKRVEINGEQKYRYHFKAGHSTIAWSGEGLDHDLWVTANKHGRNAKFGKFRPPDEIKYLRLIGLRTCAIPPNSPSEGSVYEPFASSGFLLAPMIVGFTSVFLPFQGYRR